AAAVFQGNRFDDYRARLAPTDRRRARAAHRALARRPWLFPQDPAHRSRAGGPFSSGYVADLGGIELSRHNQSLPFPFAPNRLLDAGYGHVPGGAGGPAGRIANLRRTQYDLCGGAATLADPDSPGRRAWV